MYRTEFVALGTSWWVEIQVESQSRSQTLELFGQVLDRCRQFESIFSRFDKQSKIFELNQTNVLYFDDPEIYEVLNFGIQLINKTQGLFTPLVGADLEASGYDSEYSFVASEGARVMGEKILEFSPELIRISQDAKIDIGGYGKGWLVDKLSQYLLSQNILTFTINAGGDMYICGYGSIENDKTVYLEHPDLDSTNRYVGEITVRTLALASSSTNRRQWQDQHGNQHSHIINPATKSSQHGVIATYTSGASCLAADVASTVLLINPEFDIQSIFADVEYLIVFADQRFRASPGYQGRLYA
jgi:thiamine biosynthesis lipoprotein